MSADLADVESVDVLIVGAGFGGFAMAQALDGLALADYLIVEKADAVGGTWRDNTYPGAACDVPSHLYSLSTAPNPAWSRLFPGQPEILEHLQRSSAGWVSRGRLRRNWAVRSMTWDAGLRRPGNRGRINHPWFVGQQERLRRETHFDEVDLHFLRGSRVTRVIRGSRHPIVHSLQAGQLPACQQQLR